jgi:hypothetical protein
MEDSTYNKSRKSLYGKSREIIGDQQSKNLKFRQLCYFFGCKAKGPCCVEPTLSQSSQFQYLPQFHDFQSSQYMDEPWYNAEQFSAAWLSMLLLWFLIWHHTREC